VGFHVNSALSTVGIPLNTAVLTDIEQLQESPVIPGANPGLVDSPCRDNIIGIAVYDGRAVMSIGRRLTVD
jgi:hypothetical protein